MRAIEDRTWAEIELRQPRRWCIFSRGLVMSAARAVSTDTVAIGLDMAPIESRFAEIGTFLLDSGHSVTDTRDTLDPDKLKGVLPASVGSRLYPYTLCAVADKPMRLRE